MRGKRSNDGGQPCRSGTGIVSEGARQPGLSERCTVLGVTCYLGAWAVIDIADSRLPIQTVVR